MSLAAKSLDRGHSDQLKQRAAKELLANPELLKPVEITPEINISGDSFQFTSNIVTSCPRNNVVHGRLFTVGEAWRKRPMVILVHGWNAELHYLHILPGLARTLNKQGLNAALIELPYHLQRRPGKATNGMRDFISDDLPGMLIATRQSISDIHALARWARAQGCPGVAVWGFSLGAWLAGLYVCESDLAAAAVLTTPVSNLSLAVKDLAFCHPIRASIDGATLELETLNLAGRSPKIPPAAVRVTQGVYDMFVPEETYRELAASWGLDRWETVPQSHISVLLSRKTMLNSVLWLGQQFGGGTRGPYSSVS